jgi:glycosyltransferase involved in cell wall biosynthesis
VKVSIIIPAFNEEKLLPETLRRIREAATQALTGEGWSWELVVCDNNSSDRTSAVATEGGARVVFEPQNQIGRARNTGAAAATGDWLLFIDADSHPSPELLRDMRQAISGGRVLAGGCTLRMQTQRRWARMITWLWNGASRLNRFLAGSFIFVETAAFREIGGFDTTFYVSEEIDLSKRLKRLARSRGRRVIILHHHPLCTSARKIQLYSRKEHLRFLWMTIRARGGTFRRREDCFVWYDGRR